MEMRAGRGSVLCWSGAWSQFSSSTEGILECGDFALAGRLSEPSWLILGQVTSSKGAKTITNVCVFAVVGVCVPLPLFKDIKELKEHFNPNGNVCKYIPADSGPARRDAAFWLGCTCVGVCVCCVSVSAEPRRSAVFELHL